LFFLRVLTIVVQRVGLSVMLKQNASLGPLFRVHIDEVSLRKVQWRMITAVDWRSTIFPLDCWSWPHTARQC